MKLRDSHLEHVGYQLVEFKRVLIATDFSEAARKALRYAAAIARKYNAKLHVVHVLSSVGYRMVSYDAEIQASELATLELKHLWNQIASSNGGSAMESALIVRHGDVLTEVQDLISKEKIDLVELGTRGRSGLPKVMLGSVAESIFRHITCPVLTVGPASSQDWPAEQVGSEKVILFATDFGDASLEALPYAASIANRSASKLILVNVAKPAADSDRASMVSDSHEAQDTSQVSMQKLRSLVPNTLTSESDLKVIARVPADAILAEAESSQAGLIVLGLHHHSIVVRGGHWLSTTAYNIVTGATCPVLTVRN